MLLFDDSAMNTKQTTFDQTAEA